MTMVIYKSTDASAPTLQGIVGGAYAAGWADGSLLQLLRKILVTGYGAGAQAAGAGWSQTFQGTSEGVFRQGAGCQFYLHVLDDASVTAGAREAIMYGSENQTALATSTAKFPTVSQASGVLMRKSDTADTVTRQWVCFADSKTFYLYVWTGASTAYYAGMMFGDFYSYYSGDAYNCAIIGRTTSAATDTLTNEVLDNCQATSSSAMTGHYMARGYNQLGTSINMSKVGRMFDTNMASFAAMGSVAALPYPNPSDGKFWISRVYISDPTTLPTNSVRGFLRGFWCTQAAGGQLPQEYAISGSGGISGRTVKVLGLRTGNSANGRYTMETSNTWD